MGEKTGIEWTDSTWNPSTGCRKVSDLNNIYRELTGEPSADIAICSQCNGRFPISECPTEQDGDWETGYYEVHLCPKCPEGGCVDDYDYSEEQLKKREEWKGKNKDLT